MTYFKEVPKLNQNLVN